MTALTIAGSPAASSRARRLASFVTSRFDSWGVSAGELDLRELPAEPLLRLDHRHPQLQAALAQVASASAVVVVTPVYKSSYSGLLKAFLDLLPQDGLKGKAVLAIATAGSSAHALTLDFALQPVLSALRARYVLSSVHALDYQVSWTAEAGLQLDADIACRIEEGVRHLVNSTRPHGLSTSSYPSADAFFPASAVDPELARCWD